MFWRLLSVVWIGVSLVVQVFALTAILDALQLADTAWREPFYSAGKLYAVIITMISQYVGDPLTSFIATTPMANRVTLPCWWPHLLAVYAAAGSAIWAGSMSRDERNERISQVKRGGMSIVWPLTIAGLIIQGFRNKVVTSFFRQHIGTVALYVIVVFALYLGANWANIHLLTGLPGPGQEISLVNETTCQAVNTDAISEEINLDEIRERVRDEVEERI